MNDKIARICWNSNRWVFPSGSSGKSKNKKAYEYQTKFGHEEWLLDISKLIDGYHYSYLQAIAPSRDKYLGEVYNISIYSIDDATKERWWIGLIKNVEIVSAKKSKEVFRVYKENGWHEEMRTQLEAVGADVDMFDKIDEEWFSVVRFKPSDLEVLESLKGFNHKDPAVKSDYYNLKNKVSEPSFVAFKGISFEAGQSEKEEDSSRIVSFQAREVTINLKHNLMQSAIHKQLSKLYGKSNVRKEVPADQGCRIDLVVRDNVGYVFYELKIGNSVRMCVREGLGQLLEYAHFNNMLPAVRFIIISNNKHTDDLSKYMNKLRNIYRIPLYYQYFDMDNMVLADELI